MWTRALAFVLLTLPLAPEAGSLKETQMSNDSVAHATGTFEVTIGPTGHAPDATLGSHALDKRYSGALDAIGKGEMLSAGNPATGNAGYVAIERVSGKLDGKAGTFAIMQMGVMEGGSAPQMTVKIVPGSGTENLSGISGSMIITIDQGKHSYDLAYKL